MDVVLPNGSVMTCGLPLHASLAKQVANGTLKPVATTDSPPEVVDGEGGAERVSAPPPADPTVDPSSVEMPAGNAAQSEWAAYAVSQGMDPDEAAGLKRDEIKARIVPVATEQASG